MPPCKQILLTREETLACQHGTKKYDANTQAITRAQLKKVVDELKKHVKDSGDNGYVLIKSEFWQSLLEE